MGKKNNAYNLLESYLASGLASQSTNTPDMTFIPLPDSMRSSTLLEQIGQDRNWTEDQIQHDIQVMEDNRLYYVRDLRELSNNSWKKIGLLPLVKDLIKKELNPGNEHSSAKDKKQMKKDKKKEKKERKKKEKREKKLKKLKYKNLGTPVTEGVIAETISTMNITNGNVPPDTSSSSSSSSSSSNNSEGEKQPTNVTTTKTTTDNNKKVFTGTPIKAISGNRIRIRTDDGDIFEADRYCPHKKVDLVNYGQINGRSLTCTKHGWVFALDGGGFSRKGKNINACKVNDW